MAQKKIVWWKIRKCAPHNVSMGNVCFNTVMIPVVVAVVVVVLLLTAAADNMLSITTIGKVPKSLWASIRTDKITITVRALNVQNAVQEMINNALEVKVVLACRIL
jgi:hypothetical protein